MGIQGICCFRLRCDCGRLSGTQKDIGHYACCRVVAQAGTDLSCSIWTPGFNKLADAVQQGLVPEALSDQAAERLYTARFQLGMFDPQGSNPLDKTAFADAASPEHRQSSLKAAEESIVLLKNSGALPLKSAPGHIAVMGPTADMLPFDSGQLCRNAGAPGHAAGANGRSSRVAKFFMRRVRAGCGLCGAGAAYGFRHEEGIEDRVFCDARLDGTSGGRDKGARCANRLGKCEAGAADRRRSTIRCAGRARSRLRPPATTCSTLEPADSFPYFPNETYRLVMDGKVLGEGSLRKQSTRGDGQLQGCERCFADGAAADGLSQPAVDCGMTLATRNRIRL